MFVQNDFYIDTWHQIIIIILFFSQLYDVICLLNE